MENNSPRGREKHVIGPSKKVEKRGAGLGTSPVGEAGGYQDRTSQSGGSRRSAGTRGSGTKLIVLLLALLLGGLEKNPGSVPMTDPDVLSGYIRWCAASFPASRYGLILWDHGGGSVSGYGYDEKFASSGSMNLAGMDNALQEAGVKFDFIGFDACLMATAETALTLTPYADYLIASEETEPGVGWYYTDWLTALGQDPSMPTIELGKQIMDSFVDTCAQKYRGQLTTLSVIDLAELEATLPPVLAEFSQSTTELIRDKQYRAVSDARSQTREFAQSSQIDQVDLVHLAKNLGTKEGDALADVLLGTEKYNRTSSNMTNAYGISVYFPYRKSSNVDRAASGGTASPLPALLGQLGGQAPASAPGTSPPSWDSCWAALTDASPAWTAATANF